MKKLTLGKSSESEFGGVCAGLANYMDVNVVFIRIIMLALLFSSLGFLPYLILYLAMPRYSAPTDNSK